MGRPSALVRKSLGAGPLALTLIYAVSFAALFAGYIASDATHGDTGGSVMASLVLAIAITVGLAIAIRRHRWRWLHRLPIPLDVDSYTRALDTPSDHARLALHLGFTATAPTQDELAQHLGRDASATVDGMTATIESPILRTNYRTTRGRYTTSHRSNRLLHAWFTRCVRTTLVPIHRVHPMHEIRATLVQR